MCLDDHLNSFKNNNDYLISCLTRSTQRTNTSILLSFTYDCLPNNQYIGIHKQIYVRYQSFYILLKITADTTVRMDMSKQVDWFVVNKML